MHIASRAFVGQNVLVDPLMADAQIMIFFEAFRNLLRALVSSNELLNQSPGGSLNALFRLPTPLHGHAISLLWLVASLPPVAAKLTTDRRRMDLDSFGDLLLIVSGFPWSGSSTAAP